MVLFVLFYLRHHFDFRVKHLLSDGAVTMDECPRQIFLDLHGSRRGVALGVSVRAFALRSVS